MTETRYRGTPQMRRAGWTGVALTPVMAAVVSAVFSLKGGFVWDRFLVLSGVGTVLIAPVAAVICARFIGSTTVDGTGIHAHGIVDRHLRWEDLVSLEVHPMAKGSGYALQAGLGRQRQVFLPGVLAVREDEPEFVATVEAIRAAWRDAGAVGARC